MQLPMAISTQDDAFLHFFLDPIPRGIVRYELGNTTLFIIVGVMKIQTIRIILAALAANVPLVFINSNSSLMPAIIVYLILLLLITILIMASIQFFHADLTINLKSVLLILVFREVILLFFKLTSKTRFHAIE